MGSSITIDDYWKGWVISLKKQKTYYASIGNDELARAFRILCHVKNSTASSHYSAALQNKWLTATMSNSSSGSALSIFPVRSSAPDKAVQQTVFIRESSFGFCQFPELSVYRFDSICGVNDLADIRQITEVCRQIFPLATPRLEYHRILLAPFGLQLIQRRFCGFF